MSRLNICPGCKQSFRPDQIKITSAVYGLSRILLVCESCAKLEDETIMSRGTNDLPDFVKLYESNNGK